MPTEKTKIGGILQNCNLSKVGIMSIPDRPSVAGAILSALGAAGVNCPFIAHTIDLNSLDSIVICVARADLPAALEALATVSDRVGAEVVHDREVGMVSIFGPHFGQRPGISGVTLSALASAGINILAVNTSISSLCCIVNLSDMDEAVLAIEDAFELP